MVGASGGGLILGLVSWTVVVPAVCCLAALWLSRRFAGAGWRLPSIWCGSYLTAHLGIAGVPPVPPATSTQGLVFVVLLAGAAGVPSRSSTKLRAALAAAALAALLWLTLRPMIRYQWTAPEAIVWLSGLAVAIATSARVQARVASSVSPALREAWIWGLAFGGMAAGLAISSTALLAQLAAVCAVVAVVLAVAGSRLGVGDLTKVRNAMTASLWVLGLGGAFYADLGVWRGAALVLAPLGGALGVVVGACGGGRWRHPAALAGVLVVQAPALVSAGVDFQSRASGYVHVYVPDP